MNQDFIFCNQFTTLTRSQTWSCRSSYGKNYHLKGFIEWLLYDNCLVTGAMFLKGDFSKPGLLGDMSGKLIQGL